MLRLMKYLKKSAGYIVLIVALLFLQAALLYTFRPAAPPASDDR